MNAAVLTVSDGVSAGERDDASGEVLEELLRGEGFDVARRVVTDDASSISEALVTTAVGIGAAIPAVVAYNYFTGQIRRVAVEMECFSHDFVNIVQRSALAGAKKE